MLSIFFLSLIFCQFQPGIAYKSVAYIKTCNSLFCLLFFSVLLLLKHFYPKVPNIEMCRIFLFALIRSWVEIWLYTLIISPS